MTRFIDYVMFNNNRIFHKTPKNIHRYSNAEIDVMEQEHKIKFPQYLREYLMEIGSRLYCDGDEIITDLYAIKKRLKEDSEIFSPHQLVILYNDLVYQDDSYYVDLTSDPIDPLVYRIIDHSIYKKLSDYLFSDFSISDIEDKYFSPLCERYYATNSQVLDHLDYKRIIYPYTNNCVIQTRAVVEFQRLMDWYGAFISKAPPRGIFSANQRHNIKQQENYLSSAAFYIKQDEQNVIKKLTDLFSKKIPLQNTLSWDQNGYQIEDDHVTGLIINHSSLSESILEDIFENLPFLRTLGLQLCDIDNIPKSIQNLRYLELFEACINGKAVLPSEFGNLQNLRFLNLSYSGFTQLPDQIGNLTRLQDLRLNKTHLHTLPKNIQGLKNLQFLDISYNPLQVLPTEICELTNLRFLGLSYNQLNTLPETIGNLHSLETLLCSHNQLEALPDSFGNLQQLRYCTFDHNHLKFLPQSLGKLVRLRDFSAFHNQLQYMPEEIGHLKRLRQLRLDHNCITQISPSVGNIRLLQYLNLGLNRITHIPPELTQLKYLRDLNILGNPVEPLPDWAVAWRNQHPDYRF